MGDVSRRQNVASLVDGFAAETGFWRVLGGTSLVLFLIVAGSVAYVRLMPESYANLRHDVAAMVADSRPKPKETYGWKPPAPPPPSPENRKFVRGAAVAFAVVGAISVLFAARD